MSTFCFFVFLWNAHAIDVFTNLDEEVSCVGAVCAAQPRKAECVRARLSCFGKQPIERITMRFQLVCALNTC